jgi:putative ABC transport system permease protein
MPIEESLRDAAQSIRANALRSLLTMLGVIIGTGALIAMLSIGAGAQARIAAQIRALGSNLLIAFPEVRGNSAEPSARPVHLTLADGAALIGPGAGVIAAASALEAEALVVYGAQNWSANLTGTAQEYFPIREWGLSAGRHFSRREEASAGKVALIGATVAARLFGTESPVGREVRIRNTPLEVIGVLAEKGQSGTGRDQDNTVFVPDTTARLRLGVASPGIAPETVSYIVAKAASDSVIEEVRRNIEGLLRQRHRIAAGEPPGFRVSEPAATIAAQRGTGTTIAWLLAAIASISMIVGGIGILNIMLVSVSERTHEIGIRMALGAQRRDIATLFLIEALLLCLAGGLVGIAVGIAASKTLASLAGWPVLITPETPLAALAFAIAVGAVFGYYPARKAAMLHPAEALRTG